MEKEKLNDITEQAVENENAVSTGAELVEEQQTYKEMSPIQLIFRRFFRSKLSIVGLFMILFLFLFSFLGPVIYSQWGEGEVDRTPVINAYEETYTFVDPETGEEVTVIEVVEIVDDVNKYAPMLV